MSEYLAIKNWDKRQPGREGKSAWIKDYTDKDTDDRYEKLTAFQRYALDAIRRLRGRLGKNVPNDPLYIARATHMLPRDRTHLAQAIHRLCTDGLLVVCNQEVDLLDKEKEKNRKEKKEPKNSPPAAVEKESKFALPGWIDRHVWQDYEQMRRRIGKALTDPGRELAVNKLATLQNKGHPVTEVLQQSIFNSWQGLFEIKEIVNGSKHISKLQESLDVIDKVEF